ncbi:MAG: carbohydrate ABC transporter permease [Trueperella sp.]|nr:carbohydrate ABC transporter permease [Trueperella sp.]
MDELLLSRNWWSPPAEWHPRNYVTAWVEGNMSRYYVNTCIITIPSVLGALMVSSLGAFALAWYRFRLRTPILLLFVAGMLVPAQMLMIPVYRFSVRTGLYNTYWAVILLNIAFESGFCTFCLRNFMLTIPRSIFEAAQIDGASPFRIYASIMLPLVIPAMAAIAILEFTWVWNDYLWSLVLIQSDKLKPVTLGLANMQGKYLTNWAVIAAGAMEAAIVPIIVFLRFQKYFIEGLTVGSVKG